MKTKNNCFLCYLIFSGRRERAEITVFITLYLTFCMTKVGNLGCTSIRRCTLRLGNGSMYSHICCRSERCKTAGNHPNMKWSCALMQLELRLWNSCERLAGPPTSESSLSLQPMYWGVQYTVPCGSAGGQLPTSTPNTSTHKLCPFGSPTPLRIYILYHYTKKTLWIGIWEQYESFRVNRNDATDHFAWPAFAGACLYTLFVAQSRQRYNLLAGAEYNLNKGIMFKTSKKLQN